MLFICSSPLGCLISTGRQSTGGLPFGPTRSAICKMHPLAISIRLPHWVLLDRHPSCPERLVAALSGGLQPGLAQPPDLGIQILLAPNVVLTARLVCCRPRSPLLQVTVEPSCNLPPIATLILPIACCSSNSFFSFYYPLSSSC